MRSFRSKPVGWRGESHRHYLAAKGIRTKHKYYAYTPAYVAGDLPLIATDALGTAGAAVVPWIPVIVPLALLYGGAKIVKKRKDKTGSYFADQDTMSFSPADLQAFDTEMEAAKERGDEQFMFKGKPVLVKYGKFVSEYLHGKFDEQKHFATKTDEFEAFEMAKGEDITLADAYALFAKKEQDVEPEGTDMSLDVEREDAENRHGNLMQASAKMAFEGMDQENRGKVMHFLNEQHKKGGLELANSDETAEAIVRFDMELQNKKLLEKKK